MMASLITTKSFTLLYKRNQPKNLFSRKYRLDSFKRSNNAFVQRRTIFEFLNRGNEKTANVKVCFIEINLYF